MSVIVIRYDGDDITDDVMIGSALFAQAVNGRAGQFRLNVKDAGHTYDFTAGKRVTLDIDGLRSFDGYAHRVTHRYAFPVDRVEDVERTPRIWELEGPDLNILFQKRFIYDQGDPSDELPTWPAGTHDDDIILDMVANQLNLTGDNISTAGVTHVGSPNPDHDGYIANIGQPWGAGMSAVAMYPGAVWYLSPERVLVYEDDSTENAPFQLSDTPGAGQVGYSNFQWIEDGSKMVNDALVWGAGTGSSTPVHANIEDASSITTHGRWQLPGYFRGDVYRQTTATQIANSIVYGSPQNLHGAKDPSISVRCRIKEPGLVAGMKVRFINNVFGDNKVLPVRRMTITFPTPTDALYDLELSQEIDQPWHMAEFLWRFPAFPDWDPPVWPPFPPYVPGGCGITDTFSRDAGPFTPPTTDGFIDADIGISDSGIAWPPYSVSDEQGFVDGNATLALEDGALHATMVPDPYGGVGIGMSNLNFDASTARMYARIKIDEFTSVTLPTASAEIFFELLRTKAVGSLADIDRMNLIISFQDYNGNGISNGKNSLINMFGFFDRRGSLGGSTNYWITGSYLPPSGPTVGFDFTPGSWYNILWEQNGLISQRVKIWPDEGDEPEDWLDEHSYLTQQYDPPGTLLARPADLDTLPRFAIYADSSYPGESGDLEFWLDDLDIVGLDSCLDCSGTFEYFEDTFTRSTSGTWGTFDGAGSMTPTWDSGLGTHVFTDGDEGVIRVGTGTSGGIRASSVNFTRPLSTIDMVIAGRLDRALTGTEKVEFYSGGTAPLVQIEMANAILDGVGGSDSFTHDLTFTGEFRVRFSGEVGGTMNVTVWNQVDPEPSPQLSIPCDSGDLFDGIDIFLRSSSGAPLLTLFIPELFGEGYRCITGDGGGGQPVPAAPQANAYGCQNAERLSSTLYRLQYTYQAGTTKVWRNGVIQRRGLDYHETSTVAGTFTFINDISSTDTVWVCYHAGGVRGNGHYGGGV